MNGIQNWGEAIVSSMSELSQRLIGFLPALLGALIIFLAGWIIAAAIGKLVKKLLRAAKLDRAATKIGWSGKFSGSDMDLSVSSILSGLIEWFLILVFLLAAADIMGLDEVTAFLNSILFYIPNVIVAVIILATVFLFGNFAYNIVKGSTRAAGIMSATLLAKISKWAIIIFGIFAALIQLGVASSLVSTIFIGIVAMLSLAGGLAFGLGGREEAALILKKIREDITEKH